VTPLLISRYTATSCLGSGIGPLRDALLAGRSGLKPCDFETVALDTWIGEVAGVDDEALPSALSRFHCRNNRLAALGLRQDGFDDAVRAAIGRYGADRIGVFLGTSTAGILETELAYRRRDPANGALPADFDYAGSHNPFSVATYVQAAFGLHGPASVASSACSSSAKVFASAQRMMAAGLIDAALVGGVDSLCLTTLYGFNSLELTSKQACRPFDRERDGISIGEAAAFALVERAPGSLDADAILLLGVGESSDAYHMSSPHPEGLGARRAMEAALAAAGLEVADIEYINLHGTATPSNDAAEGCAVRALFGAAVPCSSTKGATGHTLGAAGGVEAVIAALALRDGFLPGSTCTRQPEPDLDYLVATREAPIARALSNSFGFGGTNCSLVLGRAQ
jgi:3-oxoacyl-[acyl-carrier-protein] synthase I